MLIDFINVYVIGNVGIIFIILGVCVMFLYNLCVVVNDI